MLERLITLNTGHSCAIFSADGSKIITAGADHLVKIYSTNLVRSGNETPLKLNDTHTQPITALATHGSMLATGCKDQHVRLFDLDCMSLKSVIYRSTLDITHLAFSPNGKWISIGTDDGEVKLICIKDTTRTIALEGHSNTIKFVAFHPKDNIVVSSSTDGTLRIWRLNYAKNAAHDNKVSKIPSDMVDSAESVKVMRDLISRPTAGINDLGYITWHPSGSHFATRGRRQEVVVVQNGTWNIMYKLITPDPASVLQYSPNGMYLLTVGVKEHFCIWRPEVDREVPITNEKFAIPATGATWHPRSNELLTIDSIYNIGYIEKAIPAELPHPVTGQEKKIVKQLQKTDFEQSKSKLDQLFAELEAEDEPISKPNRLASKNTFSADRRNNTTDSNMATYNNYADNEEIDEEEYEEMCDFVVDDDGAGYLEDLKRPSDALRYKERSRATALSELQLGGLSCYNQPILGSTFSNEIQAAFQSGSTAELNSKRYLAFNLIGVVSSLKSDVHWTVNVEFHDKSQRPFHFTDHYGYTMSALNESGAVFACQATSSTPSTIFFRPLDNWPSKDEWTVQLAIKESALAVALTKMGIVVATDLGYLRYFSYGGSQIGIQSLAGPILTMAGHAKYLFIAYHSSGAFHGNQSVSFILMDAEKRKTIHRDNLPISPASTLEWVGFSDTMIPLTYDTKGILRGMFLHQDASWVPLLDTDVVRGTKQDHYWALGVVGSQFMCIICKNDKTPQFPKPIINELPLQVPFCQFNLTSTQMEESFFQQKLFLRHKIAENSMNMDEFSDNDSHDTDMFLHENLALDKTVLKLIHGACTAERSQRALDLCSMLHSTKSLEGATKLAIHLHLPNLASRINSIKEARYLAEKQRKAANERRHLYNHPTNPAVVRDFEYGGQHADRISELGMVESLTSQKNVRNFQVDGQTKAPHITENKNSTAYDQAEVNSVEIQDESNSHKAVVTKLPVANTKKTRNPFAIPANSTAVSVNNAVDGGKPLLPDIVNGMKLFEVISNAVTLKNQQDADKTKRSTTELAPVKRKQTTLLGMIPKPSADNTEMESKPKKPRNEINHQPTVQGSSSVVQEPVTLDQFTTRTALNDQPAFTKPPLNASKYTGDYLSESDNAEEKENMDCSFAVENLEYSRVGKGKAPADPSMSLKGFIFQK
ncbi:DNA polymerase alpha accessory factor Mcl1 [Batrachochytrium dendrobatidis]|nr:DNA polymerase alpha accessory factor Mcl1 [Batrachochytrium dendrobatidis]